MGVWSELRVEVAVSSALRSSRSYGYAPVCVFTASKGAILNSRMYGPGMLSCTQAYSGPAFAYLGGYAATRPNSTC